MWQQIAVLTIAAGMGASAQTPLTLRIEAESTPVGGMVQIQVFANEPGRVTSGHLTMDLDPAVFGPISQVAAYSASGDAIGYANVSDRHVDAHFSSPSAGIGRLPGLPVLTVTAPVTASGGATVTAHADGLWTGPGSLPYCVAVLTANFAAGGTLSVSSVTPGGGLLSSGTVITIRGTGFGASTVVSIDGVAFTAETISPERIDLTLRGAMELTGKRVRIEDGGHKVDYFCSLPSAPANTEFSVPGVHPLFPLNTYFTALVGNGGVNRLFTYWRFGLLNPSSSSIDVAIAGRNEQFVYTSYRTLRLAPGTPYFLSAGPFVNGFGSAVVLSPSPIRMVAVRASGFSPQNPVEVAIDLPALPDPGFSPPLLQIPASRPTVSWSRQSGYGAPAPQTVELGGNLPFTLRLTNSSWLKVTANRLAAPATLTFSADPAGLIAGAYNGSVAVVPDLTAPGAAVQPTVISASLQVTDQPMLSISSGTVDFVRLASGPLVSNNNTVTVSSNGAGAAFSVSTSGSWLNASPASGTTPAVVTIGANPSGLAAGSHRGQVSVQGPGNRVSVDVNLNLFPDSAPNGASADTTPTPPILGSVVNAASQTNAPLVPGAAISLYGIGLGSEVSIGGFLAETLASTGDQWNVLVPVKAGQSELAEVKVSGQGVFSESWAMPVASRAPAIFTANGTGVGQASALNADQSPNSRDNRAARGTPLTVWATGLAVDDEYVTVLVGGVESTGRVASAAAGRQAVTLTLPVETPAGPEVPIRIVAGGVPSPGIVTIAVR